MGQAASITLANKSDILYDIDEFSQRFKKATLSTMAVPMIIVAFPILNAYKFSEYEYTGVKVVDGTIGGLLGVVGCRYNFAWARAVGELVREVRKTVYTQLKENKISARKLFLVSAWSVRELVTTVNQTKYLDEDMRLIDEQRFIQALMQAVLKKRKRSHRVNK
ncbi:hypothetical protein RMATCC62417_12784 [Rhizopus microsporus]|nr:hypothetical protein RMATCC62417_12784 [Rhizopus microsporus]